MRTATTTLLDEVLPGFDFRTRHERHVRASAQDVAHAVERYDFARDTSPVTRLLFRLRGLRIPRGSIREALTDVGFAVVAEDPGEEIVIGTTGRFWTLRERDNMEAPRDLDDFRSFTPPGWAKGAMTVRIEPRDDGTSTLVTETRVLCMDDRARRRFAPYWALIRLFSGWIREDFLGGIARLAEQGESGEEVAH